MEVETGYCCHWIWSEPYKTFNVSLDALWLGTHVYTLTLDDLGVNVVSDSVI